MINSELVTAGLITGVIVRVDTTSLTATPVAKIGGACAEQHEEARCGRVLGMTFTKKGRLLACDAVFGLYMIDLDKRAEENRISESRYDTNVEYTALLTPDTLVNGSHNLVFNSLVLAADLDRQFGEFRARFGKKYESAAEHQYRLGSSPIMSRR